MATNKNARAEALASINHSPKKTDSAATVVASSEPAHQALQEAHQLPEDYPQVVRSQVAPSWYR
jgi:hypothetical protein